jgi:hypothetical protein
MVWRYGAFVMLIEFAFNFVALERLYYIPDSFIENINTAKVMNYIYNRYSFIHSNKGGSVGPFYYLNLMIFFLVVVLFFCSLVVVCCWFLSIHNNILHRIPPFFYLSLK